MSSTPVWFVTGANSGFGNAIALEALNRGHKVIATARRPQTLESLKKAGADVLELDVTAPESVIDAKVKEAHDIYGRLTYVINAAGYVLEGAVEEASEKEVFNQFNTNVFGTIKICHSVIPYLRPSPTPTAIANFGSLASWVGGPAMAFYNSSKWAVSGFTEALAAELAPFDVAVTSIEPGMFRTAFLNAGKRTGTARRLDDVYAGTGAETYRAELDRANDKQLGNVKKGASVVVDVLMRTGVAEGREVPLRVVLGTDCLKVVREKCESTVKLLNEWEAVSASTDHED